MKPTENTWSIFIDGTSFEGVSEPSEAKAAASKFLTTLLRQGHALTGQFHDFSGEMDVVEDIKPA